MNNIQKVEKLKDLLDKGFLDQDEFQKLKEGIISSSTKKRPKRILLIALLLLLSIITIGLTFVFMNFRPDDSNVVSKLKTEIHLIDTLISINNIPYDLFVEDPATNNRFIRIGNKDNAPEQTEHYVYIYRKIGNGSAILETISSPSGDSYKENTYYFDPNGKIVALKQMINSFGDIIFHREKTNYYDASFKLIDIEQNYTDENHNLVKPKENKTWGFSEREIPKSINEFLSNKSINIGFTKNVVNYQEQEILSKKLDALINATGSLNIKIPLDSLTASKLNLNNLDLHFNFKKGNYEQYLKFSNTPKISVDNKLLSISFEEVDFYGSIFITEDCLIRTYHLSAGSNGGTSIYYFSSNTNKDYGYLVSKVNNNFAEVTRDGYGDGYGKEYDESGNPIGHFWQSGKLNLTTGVITWGKIEH